VAAALANDSDHKACVALFDGLHAAGRQLLVPATVVAEVGYLLARESGARLESLFLQSLAEGDFKPGQAAASWTRRRKERPGERIQSACG
jgi:predicted nucleic acid-binding protein